uniref:Uncharacterized protein n=1 Tax=Sphaerodactylus townsendi TaxID=933632 RepID=A0ACB8EH12_9SAUR
MPDSSNNPIENPAPENPPQNGGGLPPQNGGGLPEQKNNDPVVPEDIHETVNQFIDQLSVSVTKLSLDLAKDSSSDTTTDEAVEKQNGSGDSFSGGQTSGSPADGGQLADPGQLTDSEVIVNNQHVDDSHVNKELQAILQWMVASHLNIPNLTFINENDNELSKLPQLAEKAGKKAYTVGDVLQEVKRYFVQHQADKAVGNAPRCGLMDWLLTHLVDGNATKQTVTKQRKRRQTNNYIPVFLLWGKAEEEHH